MSSIHTTDSSDNHKAANAADEYTKKAAIQQITASMAIAALLKILSRVALEGIGNILGRNKNRDRQKDSSSIDELSNHLPNGKKGGLGKSKSLTQRLGNKVRGITRGAKNGRTIKAASKANKIGRFTKTLTMAKNAGNVAKAAKVAYTAKKAHTAIKLAQVGRIAVQGGVALAGGPVGIGLLVGSVVAPIAIEHIWKNREQIYEGGKDLVSQSRLMAEDVSGILKGKNAREGEIVPEAKGLKITGDNQQTLLDVDKDGKVLTNNFAPEQKLAFYQDKQGEKSMLIDEADLNLAPSPKANIPFLEGQPSNISGQSSQQNGSSIVSNTLKNLTENNPGNPQIQQQAQFLNGNLTEAKQSVLNPQDSNLNSSIKLNEAGSSIVNLYNSQTRPGERNKPLETEEYSISRRGNDYFLRDKEGNNLLTATDTGFGTKVKFSNLNPQQVEDLGYLKQDLRLNEGITGGFAPAENKPPAAPAPVESQEVSNRNSNSHLPPPPPTNENFDTPKQEQSSAVLSSTEGTFSKYLDREKVPAVSGNSKSKDIER